MKAIIVVGWVGFGEGSKPTCLYCGNDGNACQSALDKAQASKKFDGLTYQTIRYSARPYAPKPPHVGLGHAQIEAEAHRERLAAKDKEAALAASKADLDAKEADLKAQREAFEASRPRNTEGLLLDGPTLSEYAQRGYNAENYPPQGYAVRVESNNEQKGNNETV